MSEHQLARGFLAATWLATLASGPASAQRVNEDDAPIPYPEEEEPEDRGRRDLPRRSDETTVLREESDWEKSEREETLAGLDDPNIGLSGEVVAGLLLLESSRGALVDSRFAWGLRFTWEWGRLLGDERLREALLADVNWSYCASREGTKELFTDANYHYFTIAPAYAFPFGHKSAFSLYLQAGAGFGLQFSAVHIKDAENQISGTKALFQYGLGIRGRPALVADESIRLSFRFELTRFRRQYMDDTFVGGSAGVTF